MMLTLVPVCSVGWYVCFYTSNCAVICKCCIVLNMVCCKCRIYELFGQVMSYSLTIICFLTNKTSLRLMKSGPDVVM